MKTLVFLLALLLSGVAEAATCDLKETDATLIEGLAKAAALSQQEPQPYCDERLMDILSSYVRQFDVSGQKKDDYISTLPPEKQAAVAAAIEAELLKP